MDLQNQKKLLLPRKNNFIYIFQKLILQSLNALVLNKTVILRIS